MAEKMPGETGLGEITGPVGAGGTISDERGPEPLGTSGNENSARIFSPENPASIMPGNGKRKGGLPLWHPLAGEKEERSHPEEPEEKRRRVSSLLFTAQEEEKRRVSRELHDELGQWMALLKFRLRFIQDRLPDGESVLHKECAETLRYVDQMIEEIRRISCELSPCILEDLGLAAALRWMAGNFQAHFRIAVNPVIPDLGDVIGREAQVHIYRIFQEALTNIAKHAEAGNVSIVITIGTRRISFTVQDDGRGFDLVKAPLRDGRGRGLGLITMKERVEMLGGVLDLWSREGEGTRIRFDIPIRRKPRP